MRYYHLKEDKLPPKLPVRFSFKINSTTKSICEYNKDNISGIKNWKNYLEGIKSYVSDSVIAWDNTNRHIEFPNGTKFINDFDYNVGYKILEDRISHYSFVYIFMMNLNIEEFGLQYPLKITEIKQYNTMNNTEKRIRLTEKELHCLIEQCVKETLQEGKKKDPMSQWFADFDKACKFRETMDYINKGGRNPLKKSKTNKIKEGRMLNEYEDYVGSIYDTQPDFTNIEDSEVREFASKMFAHIANMVTKIQRKYSDLYD